MHALLFSILSIVVIHTAGTSMVFDATEGRNLKTVYYGKKLDKPEEAGDEAVFFWWRLTNLYDEHPDRVRMAGLDPDRSYRVTELDRIDSRPLSYEGKSFSGKFLMENGLEIPQENVSENRSDWSSRVLRLIAE